MHVHSLYRFPVKSLAATACESLTIDEWGPSGDRRWMVVDESGGFVSQRQLPSMCRIEAHSRGTELELRQLDQPLQSITVAVPENNPVEVKVWRDECSALDAGDAPAAWLSGILGKAVRLCYMPESSHRQVELEYANPGDRVSFADGFPFLICLLESLAPIETAVSRNLAMSRFRPNIVIAGDKAFAERKWQRLRIGEIEFDLVKPCARCAIPTIDPDTAERERDVFAALRSLCGEGRDVVFGQNALHRGQGKVKVGDPVTVLG